MHVIIDHLQAAVTALDREIQALLLVLNPGHYSILLDKLEAARSCVSLAIWALTGEKPPHPPHPDRRRRRKT